jgi:putative membrane protein
MTQLKTFLSAAIASLTSLPALAWADASQGGYWHDGWGWGGMMFGGIMMIVFWGGLIVLIILAVRSFSGGSARGRTDSASGKSALDILENRFAHGEIDKAEFEERKRVLSD